MEESKESINDYQLSKVIDYDYLKIAEILNQNENTYNDQMIKKSYSHSLFTPILSYMEISEDKLNEIASTFYGEENYNGNIEELFKFKKKEILSRFKLGYSIQERIMNTLISNTCNKIIELPNLIFYSKNPKKNIF